MDGELYLPLRGEVAVASRDTEKEGIELGNVVRCKNRVVRLGRSVHLGEDLLGERLRDPA